MNPKDLMMIGAGGGGKQPKSTPDTLKSEDVVEFALALSEGPIRGLVNGAKTFFVGDTPLMDANGVRNFEKFAIGVHPGYPEGSAKPLKLQLGGVTSGTTVGVALLSGTPVVRNTSAVARGVIDELEVRIKFDRLLRSDNKGTFTADALFKIEYKKSADTTWLNFYPDATITLNGKTTAGYVRDFRVSVPRITNDDWQIRVTKVSANSPLGDQGTFVDLTLDSIQWTTKGDATYPDTAVVHGIGVANGQFSSIPDFTGVYDGLLCRVPTNYNSDLRSYDETTPWNGTFKFAWTNNPAWILYELIVNPRFGLAAYRPYLDANRYDFYQAAKFCDVVVAGQPRYTFNAVISDPRASMEMLNYIAGSFNALIWDDLSGQIHLRLDRNDPAQQIFTPENVTESGFEYTFTDITSRANEVTVTFTNPDLDWNEDKRCIPGETTNPTAIARFGRVPLEFIAVGCTNEAEAIRKARLRLISAQTETAMVTFTTALQGSILTLFDVILVADPVMGWSQSGRLSSYAGTVLTCRDAIYIETMKTYSLSLQTPDGIQVRTVTPANTGLCTKFTSSTSLPANIPAYTVFTIEEANGFGYAKPFRVMSIEEVEGSPYLFKVTAMEINRYKYDDSDNGTLTTEFDYSFKAPALPGLPSSLTLKSGDEQLLVGNGTVTPRILATWRRPLSVVVREYELQWRMTGDDDWNALLVTSESQYISPVVKGAAYDVRVRSIDDAGNKSAWAEVLNYTVIGKAVIPANLTSFTATGDLFQIKLNWVWSGVDSKTLEIYSSATNDTTTKSKLVDVAYPNSNWTHLGLDMAKTLYYWYRVIDTSGNASAFNATSVSATTISSPSRILAVLQDSITTTQLAATLNTRINLVDGPATTAGTVAAQVKAEVDARIKAISDEVTDRNAAIKVETDARVKAVSDEATARANAITDEALTRGTAITNEQKARQDGDTGLTQSIALLTAVSGGGFDPAPGASWYFDANVEGWTIGNGTQVWNAGSVEIQATTNDPFFTSPGGLAIDGSKYRSVRARIKRLAGSGWDGVLFYTTAAHPSASASYYKRISVPPILNIGDTAIVEWDMSTLSVGGTDWITSTITQIRLDLGGDPADKFAVDWVAVGRSAPAASVAALQTEITARTTLTDSHTQSISTLTSTVNDPTTGLAKTRSDLVTNYRTAADQDTANSSLSTTLTSSINKKTASFKQQAVPMATAIGDIWIDAGSTNLLLRSQEIENSYWLKTRTQCTSGTHNNVIAAPDGTTTADKLVEDSGATSTSRYLSSPNVALASPPVVSVYLKAGERTKAVVTVIRDNGASYSSLSNFVVDLTNGTFTGGDSSCFVQNAGEGWWRCGIKGQTLAAVNGNYALRVLLHNGTSTTYIGTAGNGIYVWGAQLEDSSAAGRYIPTSTATVSTVGNNKNYAWDGTTWASADNKAIGDIQASLVNDYYTKTAADSAIASAGTTLTTNYKAYADQAELDAIAAANGATDTKLGNYTTTASLTTNYYTKSQADSAISAASTTLTSSINKKNATFKQQAVPTATAIGDLWLDSGSKNLITNSATFQPKGGGPTFGTYVIDQVAPDGTTTASRMTVASSRTFIEYTVPNGTYTFSVNVKRLSGSASNTLQLKDGVSDTIRGTTTFTNGTTWQRVSVTGTTAGTTAGVRIEIPGSAVGDIYWGAQLELTPAMGRYIPTTSAAVDTTGNNKTYAWDGVNWVSADNKAIGDIQASLVNDYYTKTAADSAIASAGTTLTTNYKAYADQAELDAIAAANGATDTKLSNYTTTASLTTNYYTKSQADSAISAANTTLSSAIGTKNASFKQQAVPTATAIGDIWIDSGSTNLIWYSQLFSNAKWAKTNASVVAAPAVLAPDGTATAFKLLDNATNGNHLTQQTFTTSVAGTYTISIYAKAGELNVLRLRASDNVAYISDLVVDLNTGTRITGDIVKNWTITNAGDGWWRLTRTATTNGTITGIVLGLWLMNSNTGTSYVGTGTGCYIWGAQCELQALPGRYIMTPAGASVSTVGNNKNYAWDGAGWVSADNKAIGDIQATLVNDYYTSAQVNSAISSATTTLSSRLDNAAGNGITMESAMTTQANRATGLEAQYTVKVQTGTNYVTGFGLATTVKDGTPTSSFIVNVDKFAIIKPGTAAGQPGSAPFMVGNVNGTSVVGINGALVVDGSIVAKAINTNGLTVRDSSGNIILDAGSTPSLAATTLINNIQASMVAAPPRNMLRNPTGRQGTTYWTAESRWGGYVGTNDTYFYNSGTGVNNPRDGATRHLYQPIEPAGWGTTYTVQAELSCDTRDNGFGYLDVLLDFQHKNSAGTWTYIDPDATTPTRNKAANFAVAGWQKVSFTVKAPPLPNGSTSMRVVVYVRVYMNMYEVNAKNIKLAASNAVSTYTDETTVGTAVWGETNGAGRPADYADVTSINRAASIAGQGNFATLNAVYDWNIGNYFGGAAITNAFIGGAAITNAKINNLEVNTIKLAQGSVTSINSYGNVYNNANAYLYLPDEGYGTWWNVVINGFLEGGIAIQDSEGGSIARYDYTWLRLVQHGTGNIYAEMIGSNAYVSKLCNCPPGEYYLHSFNNNNWSIAQQVWVLSARR